MSTIKQFFKTRLNSQYYTIKPVQHVYARDSSIISVYVHILLYTTVVIKWWSTGHVRSAKKLYPAENKVKTVYKIR